MARNLYFELGPDVADKLRQLTDRYGEPSPEAMIARALGLLEMVAPFLHDGLLTVVDTVIESDDPADREVDLSFEGLVRQHA